MKKTSVRIKKRRKVIRLKVVILMNRRTMTEKNWKNRKLVKKLFIHTIHDCFTTVHTLCIRDTEGVTAGGTTVISI